LASSHLAVFSTLGIGILIATLSSSQQQAMRGAFAFISGERTGIDGQSAAARMLLNPRKPDPSAASRGMSEP